MLYFRRIYIRGDGEVDLAIIGDIELESFFDKIDTKDNYKLAQLNGKGCAFLCVKNELDSNLEVIKKLGINKVVEITKNDIDEDKENVLLSFGIEYSGFSVKGKKAYVKTLLAGIMSEVNDSKVNLLSDREKEVLGLLTRGMTNRDIAKSLYLSEKTVKNHLNNIFKKIDVTDRTKAALFGINNNI